MTKITNDFPFFKDLDKFAVGFNDYFNTVAQMQSNLVKTTPNYPPYNIKKIGENQYEISLAVAGFDQEELNIQLKENVPCTFRYAGGTSLHLRTAINLQI